MKSDYKALLAALLIFIGLIACFVLVDKTGKSSSNANADSTAQPVVEPNATATTADGDAAFVDQTIVGSSAENAANSARLRPFDPNTADAETLHELGLSEYLVRGILRYRSRGGVYSSPEDFARVPGLTKGLYKTLRPYIRIADDFRPAAELVGGEKTDKSASGGTSDYPAKIAAGERISLNDADSATLRRVPGIGPFYAAKIIELRNRYGGFVSLSQLAGVKGLPDECYQYFFIPDGNVRKINLNTAEFRTMQAHPYIGYNRARTISDYRRLRGRISSLEQLSLLDGFSEAERKRLEPYVEF